MKLTKAQEAMTIHKFEQEYLCQPPPPDPEYDWYLSAWVAYRKQAEWYDQTNRKVTLGLHQKYFPQGSVINKEKYQHAKMESLRRK